MIDDRDLRMGRAAKANGGDDSSSNPYFTHKIRECALAGKNTSLSWTYSSATVAYMFSVSRFNANPGYASTLAHWQFANDPPGLAWSDRNIGGTYNMNESTFTGADPSWGFQFFGDELVKLKFWESVLQQGMPIPYGGKVGPAVGLGFSTYLCGIAANVATKGPVWSNPWTAGGAVVLGLACIGGEVWSAYALSHSDPPATGNPTGGGGDHPPPSGSNNGGSSGGELPYCTYNSQTKVMDCH